jgi:hypothetical protein
VPLNVAFILYVQSLQWNGSNIFTIFVNLDIYRLKKIMNIDNRFIGTWTSGLVFNHNKGYSEEEYQTFGGYIKITTDTNDELILRKPRKSDYQKWVGLDHYESEEKWDTSVWHNSDEEYDKWCSNADWKLSAYDTLIKTYASISSFKIISPTVLSFEMQFLDYHRNRFNGQTMVDNSYYDGKYELIGKDKIKCTMSYSKFPIKVFKAEGVDDYSSKPYTIFFKRKKFLGIF